MSSHSRTVTAMTMRATAFSVALVLAVTSADLLDTGGAQSVNTFLRSAVMAGEQLGGASEVCFWTEMPDKTFERGTAPPFDQTYPSLAMAQLACTTLQSNCRAVSQEGEVYFLSDQRAADAEVGASSWVHECGPQDPSGAAAAAAASGSGPKALQAAGRGGTAVEGSSTEFLHIKVLTMDRLQSLKRLMDSLKNAHYDGDTVHLDVYVDYPPATDATKLQSKLNTRKLIIDYLETFDWPHGKKMIHVRARLC
jgi:hypothetical protein